MQTNRTCCLREEFITYFTVAIARRFIVFSLDCWFLVGAIQVKPVEAPFQVETWLPFIVRQSSDVFEGQGD